MSRFIDSYNRQINYMRISITDRCNLRCVYCMPSDGVKTVNNKEILTLEEIIRIAKIATDLGVRKIRITGGEPLIRKNIVYLISSLSKLPYVEDLSLTTNGLLLKQYAHSLALAGLKRVNISLDSLDAEKYKSITRGGDIKEVIEGIKEAERWGLTPIKINVVPVRGFNDSEIENFAYLSILAPYQIRFIEFMPIGDKEFWNEKRYITTNEIKERLLSIAPLIPVTTEKSGPANYFKFKDAKGLIGFISPISNHFCFSCNRLRLTADGKIRPCLFSKTEIDLKSPLRHGASDEEIKRLLRLSVEIKPLRHEINEEDSLCYLNKSISQIGG
ncbi:MAG: GTP 3',8-cyclase MoaA [Thermodesulfovibrionales bacterium]|nr:GTP 3',8-cyclase MoaA [Thermodesulfovibrionales bacterium]